MEKKKLCGLTADEILNLIEPYGFNLSHSISIANSVYKKKTSEISQITKIPRKLKEDLDTISTVGIYRPVSYEISEDKSVKYLFINESGLKFETVYIPDNKRNTICVSTQSGCRMGCRFCATAKYSFRGNLSAGDIINQIIGIPDSGKVTHIVFMGMGEPFDNIENVLKACKIITAEWGLAISSRNVTVSTVGITTGIEQFFRSTYCNLTISLFSPFAEERIRNVPVERLYPVENLIEKIKNFPVNKKRRLSVAYVMIKDLNDTDQHLEGLKALLTDSKIRVNLLPYHPITNNSGESATNERMQFFKHNLVVSGISASVRKSRGTDIFAACGLLASRLDW